MVGAVETFELSLKLASLVGDEQAQDAIKKALKDVNNKIVQGLKADGNPDNAEGNQGGSSEQQQPQAAEDNGEKQEATGDEEGKKEATEDDKPTENTEQEQVDT